MLVCSILATLSWIVFLGGFGHFNVNLGGPIVGHDSVRFYFPAVATPILVILLVVLAIMYFLKTTTATALVNFVLTGITIAILFTTIIFLGTIVHELSVIYSAGLTTDHFVNTYFAGALMEIIFLGLAFKFLNMASLFTNVEE